MRDSPKLSGVMGCEFRSRGLDNGESDLRTDLSKLEATAASADSCKNFFYRDYDNDNLDTHYGDHLPHNAVADLVCSIWVTGVLVDDDTGEFVFSIVWNKDLGVGSNCCACDGGCCYGGKGCDMGSGEGVDKVE